MASWPSNQEHIKRGIRTLCFLVYNFSLGSPQTQLFILLSTKSLEFIDLPSSIIMAVNAELPVFLSNDPLVNPKVTEALADHSVPQESKETQSLMTNEPLKIDENLRDTDAYKRTSIITERMVAPSEPTSSSDVVSPVSRLPPAIDR